MEAPWKKDVFVTRVILLRTETAALPHTLIILHRALCNLDLTFVASLNYKGTKGF